MHSDQTESPLSRYLSGLAEHVFQTSLGIADPSMSDYISNLLIRFTRTDQLQPHSNVTGRRLSSLYELLSEAQSADGDESTSAHRQIGDHTLFWVGLFPESLDRDGPSRMQQYRGCGKRAYLVASSSASSDESAGLLQRLAHQFDACAEGLLEIRDHWQQGNGSWSGFLSA